MVEFHFFRSQQWWFWEHSESHNATPFACDIFHCSTILFSFILKLVKSYFFFFWVFSERTNDKPTNHTKTKMSYLNFFSLLSNKNGLSRCFSHLNFSSFLFSLKNWNKTNVFSYFRIANGLKLIIILKYFSLRCFFSSFLLSALRYARTTI